MIFDSFVLLLFMQQSR